MSNIVREDRDALNAVITVTVAKDDYQPKLQAELEKFRKKANLKGFRPGKAPMSFIRKMYGKGVLADIINKQLQQDLSDYLAEGQVDFLGQPLPSTEQEQIDFDLGELEDYEFKFDLGIAPAFEVQGVGPDDEYTYYKVEVTDEEIDDRLQDFRKRQGNKVEVETVEAEDIITFEARELTEAGEIKEGGVTSEFSLFYKNATPALKEQLLGKAVGDTVRVNIYEVEENTSEAFVRNYLLSLPKDEEQEEEVSFHPEFELRIQTISRTQPAELNQEFFDQLFGEGEVGSEEEARQRLRENMEARTVGQSEALFYRNMQDALLEKNPLELPDDFLKRWLKSTSEQNTDQLIESGYENFAKTLQWTLIRNKLLRQYEIEVKEEEIIMAMQRQILGYFGGSRPEWLTDDMVNNMMQRMLSDQAAVEKQYDELSTEKLFARVREEVHIKEEFLSQEAMDARLEELRREAEQVNNVFLDEEE